MLSGGARESRDNILGFSIGLNKGIMGWEIRKYGNTNLASCSFFRCSRPGMMSKDGVRKRGVLRRIRNDGRVLRVVDDDLMCKSVEVVWRWWGREGLVGKCQRR